MSINITSVCKLGFLSGLLLTTLTACDQQTSSNPHIAYVDLNQVIKKSPVGDQQEARLKMIKDTLLKASSQANDLYKDMPEAQKTKSMVADAAVLNKEWQREVRKTRATTMQAIVNSVEKYRKGHGISLVLTRGAVLSGNAGEDISNDIITSLADTHVNYGKLPEVQIKKQSEQENNK
ncbi:OmpH family outer membrane protein [Scandinavium goeteborgense]|uniref:OmpH family outer membrane protein n=1 Tax=Scandinavium goeteborgense TaxID=1851514 RepID=UPI0021665418|nr:OmpH family outer membrane protein [Scandinavium goeteborgense]MCS2151061.1 OmpH family outer membrane protein [Scandinavium goeteborgense]